MENIFTENIGFRTEDNTFQMSTSIVRDSGSNGCGSYLLKPPDVNVASSVFLEPKVDLNTKTTHYPLPERSPKDCISDRDNLYNLAISVTERVINEGKTIDIIPSGSCLIYTSPSPRDS